MGRGKVQLKLIEKKSLRKSTYQKRIGGLKKKAHELSVLCNVPAMLLSFDSDGKLDVWPENPEELHCILNKYHNSCSKKVPTKNKLDSESFILSEIKKKETELNHMTAENNLLQNKVIDFLDLKLGEVKDRISLLNNNNQLSKVEMPGTYLPSMNFISDNQVITESNSYCDQLNDFSDFDGLIDLVDLEGLPFLIGTDGLPDVVDFEGLPVLIGTDGLPDVVDFDSAGQDIGNDTRLDNSTLDYKNSRSHTNCEHEYEVNQCAMEPPACESITEFNDYCDEGEDYSYLGCGPTDLLDVEIDFCLNSEESSSDND